MVGMAPRGFGESGVEALAEYLHALSDQDLQFQVVLFPSFCILKAAGQTDLLATLQSLVYHV